MPQVQTVCFETAARLAMVKERRFARRRLVRHAPSATLHNLPVYRQQACLSFHNAPDRKAGRKSPRRSQF